MNSVETRKISPNNDKFEFKMHNIFLTFTRSTFFRRCIAFSFLYLTLQNSTILVLRNIFTYTQNSTAKLKHPITSY